MMNKLIYVKILFFSLLFFSIAHKSVFANLASDYIELKVTFGKDNGEVCSADPDCVTGNCVDGYCCNTSCSGGCESCALSGTEGTCTTRSEGDNTECTTCNYCDGSNTTCQFVDLDTDPYDDCDSPCISSCEDYTGFCDGAGSCDTSYCSAGTSCLSGSCETTNFCNDATKWCSCEGDNCYDDGGDQLLCEAQCDGSGNCDYAGSCTTNEIQTYLRTEGTVSLNNLSFDYFGPGATVEFCTESYDYNSSGTINGDLVYCDSEGGLWTPTVSSTYMWYNGTEDNSDNSCIGDGSAYSACNYCDTLDYAGYNDWYLPTCTGDTSLPESCQLYQFGVDACSWAGTDGSESSCTPAWDTNAVSGVYKSSSEETSSTSYVVNFSNGDATTETKSTASYIRCTREDPPFCSVPSDYETNTTIEGDVVYCDSGGEMWTPTSQTNPSKWTDNLIDEPDDSCIGKGVEYPACNYCDTLDYAGYTDWYLPECPNGASATCEMRQLYIEICASITCYPSWDPYDASTYLYWTSSEYTSDTSRAYYIYNNDGSINFAYKYTTSSNIRARCMR